MKNRANVLKLVGWGVGALFSLIVIFSGIYTVPEGHVGVVTQFSKAVSTAEPGLNFKIPFIQGVRTIEVRERKNVEELAGATANQLPITAIVSINWTVNRDSVLDLFKRYGSLDQFEQRILDPKLRQAAKAGMAKSQASELIRNREQATADIMSQMVELMAPYPITVNSPQIEQVSLPETYRDSVLAKEKAREDAAKEQYNLERQALEAQREVQTANADRDARKARADGDAYAVEVQAKADAEAIRLKGLAEAEVITERARALGENENLVDYQRALQWNGQMPSTIMGGDQSILWQMQK